jgi:hypothetical protein
VAAGATISRLELPLAMAKVLMFLRLHMDEQIGLLEQVLENVTALGRTDLIAGNVKI